MTEKYWANEEEHAQFKRTFKRHLILPIVFTIGNLIPVYNVIQLIFYTLPFIIFYLFDFVYFFMATLLSLCQKRKNDLKYYGTVLLILTIELAIYAATSFVAILSLPTV